MIDPILLDRHLVVEKKDDITTIITEQANSPFSTDELLKRAIGSSIFECLQPINIIFAGYLDRQLFEIYTNNLSKYKDFNNYGKVFLSGISGVETLVQVLILAQKKFIIVADSDETSKNKRIDFAKNYPEYKNNWIAYGDLDKTISTMEDFMTPKYLQEHITKLGYQHKYDDKKNAISNIETAVGKDKALKQTFKNSLISEMKKIHIQNKYADFVSDLQEKIKKV